LTQNESCITAFVNDFAKRENCIIGICDASPLVLEASSFTPFVSRNHTKRTSPAANLHGVRSIIVIGVESKIVDFAPMPEGAGVLSVLGVAPDYHIIVKALLKKLVGELQQHTKHNLAYKILVDSPTLDERALAVRAGLGFIGRNGLVIAPEYGSRFNIGVLLTDMAVASLSGSDLEGDTSTPPVAACPSGCRNCIAACPTGAISESGMFDVSRCISYITQKDSITPDEAALLGRQLYGCDICQDACPLNPPQPTAWANPGEWLAMSDEDFMEVYGHTAMLWRGAMLLRRNAGCIC